MRAQRSGRPPQYLFPDKAQFGVDNLVLHAVGKRHVVKDFPGPLSIKSVVKGEVAWIVDGRDLVVDCDSFLVLNDGQKYSMDMDALRPMETCCAFFSHGFVEQVAQDATTPLQASLDSPTRPSPSLSFLSRLHKDSDGSILPRLRSLAARCSRELQPSSFEEDFLVLSAKLVMLYKEIRAQMERVPAARASTREEVFRRLQHAREYMHGSADQQISLKEVAREACLSRYHLHRAFTRVFRQTPHAYLTGLRLEKAHASLKAGCTVTEACVEVGFSSPSSFSRLFSSHYGFPPSSVRKSW
jgi:AraC family transcriptional regulator